MGVNVITGAKAIIKIDGDVAGYATGISVSEISFNGRVDSLGFIDTREVVPIGRNVSGTINFIRIFKSIEGDTRYDTVAADETDEIAVVNSAEADDDDITRTRAVLNRKEFLLEIFDNHNTEGGAEALMYAIHGCRISSQNIVVDRGSMMGVQCTFDATHLVRIDQPVAPPP